MSPSSLTYEQIKAKLNDSEVGFESVLSTLEKKIIKARDDVSKSRSERLPVYLTKYRFKTPESCYLKTKRDLDINKLTDIKDLLGLRVLCLFEEHIFNVHEFIMKLQKDGLTIKAVKVFNWDKNNFNRLLDISKRPNCPSLSCNPKLILKGSGYRSIHYQTKWANGNTEYDVEIQLRTLLQDVWGELEHKLNYKQGNINPHIKRSFELLSLDLGTMDMLLTHLKDTYDKECQLEKERRLSGYPAHYFPYDQIKPPTILAKGKLKKTHAAYLNFCTTHLKYPVEDKKLNKAESQFNKLNEKIRKTAQSVANTESQELNYWLKMEKAYYDFASKKPLRVAKALKTYDEIIIDARYKNTAYVPYFRRGEIHYRTDLVKALDDFDRCELIAERINKSAKIDPINLYLIKSRLAYIYSSCGIEFLDHAIKKIKEAKGIFDKKRNKFDDCRRRDLFNNLCWYHLEKFIALKDEKNKAKRRKALNYYHKAFDYWKQLSKLLKNGVKGYDKVFFSDTAAWLYYQAYQDEKNVAKRKKHLKKAVTFIRDAYDRDMKDDVISEHFVVIMGADEREK